MMIHQWPWGIPDQTTVTPIAIHSEIIVPTDLHSEAGLFRRDSAPQREGPWSRMCFLGIFPSPSDGLWPGLPTLEQLPSAYD